MRGAILCGLSLFALLLAGCISLSIGGKTVVAPSAGEQLTHLQSAYEAGAITDTEYDNQKQKILENSPLENSPDF